MIVKNIAQEGALRYMPLQSGLSVTPFAIGSAVSAGIGGGWVISPNTTMTLQAVPVHMAGSAGGALQTGQRIGAAIGGAGLVGLFYALPGGDLRLAVAVSVGVAAATVAVALMIAVFEWRTARPSPAGRPMEHAVES